MPDPVSAIIGGVATIGGAVISSKASSKASEAMAQGADASAALQYQAAIEASQISADAQKEAARIQAEASDRATAELRRQYEVSGAELAPWRKAGEKALGTLEQMTTAGPGEFKESPGYQFRLAEGTKALERGAAARGMQLSGAENKALTQFGQDYATSEYDNFLNRYYQSLVPYESISGQGLSAAARSGQIGTGIAQSIAGIETGTANAIASGLLASAAQQGAYKTNAAAGGANALMTAAQARASGYINSANALTGMVGQGLNAGALYYAMK